MAGSYIKQTGKVIEFDNEKGFGYILPDSEEITKKVFLHFSEISSPSPILKSVMKEDKILFEIRDFTPEILQAVKVEVIQ